ncbi:MAG: 1,6-dihydroxycyclohexa-2,4-diene-1-carboxylate dehydrogenase [Microvirga sp.]
MMHHPDRFKGKVAVVTGAAQGIGRMVAVNLAKEGGQVALVDRSEVVNETHEEIAAAGADSVAILADLEQYGDVCRVMAEAKERFGRIDILINNVGGTIWAKPFGHYEEDQIVAEVRRSLFPTLWCCHAVLPVMLEQKGGTIVNVSSIATRGINRVPYAAAKGGVNAMTASLAFEYASQGIRVCGIAPGGTEAPPRKVPRNLAAPKDQSAQEKAWWREVEEQTKASTLMKRYGTLEEQAAAILFFASDEASYITGLILPVGGGDLG